MTIDILRRIGSMILLVLIQALVLNRIHLFGYATPLLFVYFVITYRRATPYWLGLPLAFLLGLAVDSFTNTPGVATSSLTLTAFIQHPVLNLYLDEESEENFRPCSRTMGWVKFITYAFILSFVFCVVYFSVEAFSFHHVTQWALTAASSWFVTLILILTVDIVRR